MNPKQCAATSRQLNFECDPLRAAAGLDKDLHIALAGRSFNATFKTDYSTAKIASLRAGERRLLLYGAHGQNCSDAVVFTCISSLRKDHQIDRSSDRAPPARNLSETAYVPVGAKGENQ